MNYYNIERSSCIENLSTESESGVELCICKNKDMCMCNKLKCKNKKTINTLTNNKIRII